MLIKQQRNIKKTNRAIPMAKEAKKYKEITRKILTEENAFFCKFYGI